MIFLNYIFMFWKLCQYELFTRIKYNKKQTDKEKKDLNTLVKPYY